MLMLGFAGDDEYEVELRWHFPLKVKSQTGALQGAEKYTQNIYAAYTFTKHLWVKKYLEKCYGTGNICTFSW